MHNPLASSLMHNIYTKFNTANGKQLAQETRAGLMLTYPFNFQDEVCKYRKIPGALRSQKSSSRNMLMGRIGKRGRNAVSHRILSFTATPKLMLNGSQNGEGE